MSNDITRAIYRAETQLRKLELERDDQELTIGNLNTFANQHDRTNIEAMTSLFRSYTENRTEENYQNSVKRIKELKVIRPETYNLQETVLNNLEQVYLMDQKRKNFNIEVYDNIKDGDDIKIATDLQNVIYDGIENDVINDIKDVEKFARYSINARQNIQEKEDMKTSIDLTLDTDPGDFGGFLSKIQELLGEERAVQTDDGSIMQPALSTSGAKEAIDLFSSMSRIDANYDEALQKQLDAANYVRQVQGINELKPLRESGYDIMQEIQSKSINDDGFEAVEGFIRSIPYLKKSVSDYGSTEKNQIANFNIDQMYKDNNIAIVQIAQNFINEDGLGHGYFEPVERMLNDEEKYSILEDTMHKEHALVMDEFIRKNIDALEKLNDDSQSNAPERLYGEVLKRLLDENITIREVATTMDYEGKQPLFSPWKTRNWLTPEEEKPAYNDEEVF
tara:strand:+ start:1994 stop:3340 length:1347 start_codon:yes stop_codon:yes gene_type:complete